MEQLSNLEKLQTEYKTVLGSLDEAIITRGSNGLKYFNTKGRQLLEHTKNVEDLSTKDIISSEIDSISDKIEKKKYQWQLDETNIKAQNLIFNMKLFKPSFKEKTEEEYLVLEEEEVQPFSLEELIENQHEYQDWVFTIDD